jgi:hypothetical protein
MWRAGDEMQWRIDGSGLFMSETGEIPSQAKI